jgi:type IV secretory pathway ATPase VirB11/archaellum biosynthesis ATPase
MKMRLKNTLRQAPDVILIGEIRSRETMEHAIAFAETGHCVCQLYMQIILIKPLIVLLISSLKSAESNY